MSNPCVIPTVPSDGLNEWLEKHARHIHKSRNQSPNIILIGASIIELIQLYRIWCEQFDPLNSLNFGISGDRTENVLWRVQNGLLEHIAPKVCILNIGSNNIINPTCVYTDVAEGILAIVDSVRSKLPDCHIIIIGLLPCGPFPNEIRSLTERTNDIVGQRVENMDKVELYRPNLLQPDGKLNEEDAFDYLHPTERGYRKIFNPLFQRLRRLIDF